jgi:CheY-like chemotaxis protein
MMSHKSTILIVDDEPIGRQLIDAILYKEGYNLEFAENGREAFEKAKALNPDLILMDVMMPEIDGFEVCQMLRADENMVNVPIILVTALDDIDSRIRGLEAGADDYISKPFDRLELLARIKIITRLNRYRKSEGQAMETTGQPQAQNSLSNALVSDLAKSINKLNFGKGAGIGEVSVSKVFSGSGTPPIYGAFNKNGKNTYYMCGAINESPVLSLYTSNIISGMQNGAIDHTLVQALAAIKPEHFKGAESIKPLCAVVEKTEGPIVVFTGINASMMLIKKETAELIEGNDLDLLTYTSQSPIQSKPIACDAGDKIIIFSSHFNGLKNNGEGLLSQLKQLATEHATTDIVQLNTVLNEFLGKKDIEKQTGEIVIMGITL